ncbi:MAG: hypothetical protein EOO03_09020 [Chitinophagaceae bacterium]|nr:MAG: hypothetical protein EOO03_09020 [Chitinophagaceae bacterium]
MNVNDINYKINRFVDSFGKWLLMAMILASAGILMKMWALPAGGFVFVFSILVLAVMFVVQIALSFVYIVSNVRLALLGSFCSLGLVMAFLAIIFRYQVWFGWQIMLLITMPMYFLSALVLVYFLIHKKKFHLSQYKFLVKNLVVPFVFTMLLLLVSFVLSPDTFYETFKPREIKKELRKKQEQQQQQREGQKPDEQYEI